VVHDVVASRIPQLRALCLKHRVRTLEVFGSAAEAGRFEVGRSDVDLIVDFEPQPREGFNDVYFRMLDDLRALFGCEVHLVEKGAVRNRYFVESLSTTRTPIYAAA
jgi:predicted nucleotidyltransferase